MESLACSSEATRGAPAAAVHPDWRTVLAEAVREPSELCRLLELPPAMTAAAEQASGDFPLLVPRTYLSRIRPGDPDDPLLVQVLPRQEERAAVYGFSTDPVGEAAAACSPGLLWKYRGRLLIVATQTCAVHCRYCFRRHFPYHGFTCGSRRLEAAVARIGADRSIHEVILSGGDPLVLEDPFLAHVARRLAGIPHLRRLRLHTRLPVMIPQRVNDELLGWLKATRLTPIVVVQINHPAEVDAAAATALRKLVEAGIPTLNQSVLLHGVNDRIEILAELCERLVDLRVMPYYLHQLDRVAGAAHFEVPEATGIRLTNQLRALLPGYAVPRYVRETRGGPSKELLA